MPDGHPDDGVHRRPDDWKVLAARGMAASLIPAPPDWPTIRIEPLDEDLPPQRGHLPQTLLCEEVKAQVADANRKVNRQARAIRRLEAKLREARQRPYEGTALEETP